MIDAAIYEGLLNHARNAPKAHQFEYRIANFYCDLDLIPELCQRSKLLSHEGFNWVSFYRQDYLPSHRTLREEVVHQIEQSAGVAFSGKICLLANWRSFGLLMNPITIFYCYEDEELCHVVVEVHNTPWNDRHVYVVSLNSGMTSQKQFHVSPFMPMDTQYHWLLPKPGEFCTVNIGVSRAGKALFGAGFNLRAQSFTTKNIRKYCLSYPFQAAQVLYRIYWQALMLYLKRMPIYTHPDRGRNTSEW